VGSSPAAPLGARLLGAVLALAGVALLVVGVLALGNRGSSPPAAGPAPSSTAVTTAATSPSPVQTSAEATSAPPVTTTTTTAPPPPSRPAVARAPLTVLNNSTIAGLADRAAAAAERRGWRIVQVGNFAGRLPMTTAYYTPGNAAEEQAARELAAEFPQIGQVLPRYAGLPPTPPGVVLVVTRDWT